MLTAAKLAEAGIVLESIHDGEVKVTTTRRGSQMVCGRCGATSRLYADSDQARTAGEQHVCPEPAA